MKHELELAVASAVRACFGIDVACELTRPDAAFGDYATNVALQLTKTVGMPPRTVAEKLAETLRGDERLAEVSIAGPGFINMSLTVDALAESLKQTTTQSLAGRIVLVEYSDPNPFKPLHAGHLYTTLVGDTISRLVENAGAKTTRLNFGGDVGLHAGKSMWAIVKYLGGEYPEKLEEISEDERPGWLGARYVEGNDAYEDDEVARAEIITCNKRVYALHDNNERETPFAKLYWTCRKWSYDYFAQLYKQLEVLPFDRYIPESEVTPLGLETVKRGLEQGVYEESDGAVVFKGDESAGLHTRVFINREGLPTYETKDVGLSLTKWRDYHFDESIIITANEQAQYMRVVIAAIHQIEPQAAERTTHLTHGVVKLQGGIKMSSRKGNIVSALDILESARIATTAIQPNATEETVLAAVKYAFVKNRIGGDIIYDPKESVALEGNSGPYLQYAHARARSILSKAQDATTVHSTDESENGPSFRHSCESGNLVGQDTAKGDAHNWIPDQVGNDIVLHPDERLLVRKLTEYNEAVDKATNELLPHHICSYLYELAQEFNRFYEKNRVIGDERETLRLGLVKTYADTLKAGLSLLGIHAPDRM